MIVVSDTSPLNYLIVTDCVSVLRDLYELVMIPPAVFAELNDPAAPPKAKEFFFSVAGMDRSASAEELAWPYLLMLESVRQSL